MAFSTTTSTTQPVSKPIEPQSTSNNLPEAILGLVLLSVYGAKASKKTVRKLKWNFYWTAFKLKIKNLLKPKPNQRVSDRTLIYILIGVALIALVVLEPVAALVLAILALILILAGII